MILLLLVYLYNDDLPMYFRARQPHAFIVVFFIASQIFHDEIHDLSGAMLDVCKFMLRINV